MCPTPSCARVNAALRRPAIITDDYLEIMMFESTAPVAEPAPVEAATAVAADLVPITQSRVGFA
jgi:hypothetical protein